MTTQAPPSPAADVDPAGLAHSDVETDSIPAIPAAPPPPAETEEPEPGPGRIDAFFRRAVACGTGLALVVAFFFDWQRGSGVNLESYSGLDLATKGTLDPVQAAAIWAVPLLGALLVGLGAWGRRPALIGSLLIGLSLLLVGTWQTLAFLAQSIGPGLWISAGAAFVALLGGIPWQRIIRGMRKS